MSATQQSGERINDWDELYPGRFLKAGLLGQGEKRVLTISGVSKESLMGNKGKQIKGILAFKEDEMGLALNKTNGVCLREMFGRVPYKWEGKRVALFASEWAGEPCIRIWGSPDIERDFEVTIELPQRKPIKMTMHAMGAKVRPVAAAPRQELGEDARGQLAAMAAATTLEALMDVEADMAVRTFNDAELATLNRAIAKRRKQITDGQ